ncbi:MAG: response regulator transcription factor [Candidatus Eremiobacteraeota bacterium]|nr:response regulator transcription factor [Candidatus Eremiobacteraeota bacterium]
MRARDAASRLNLMLLRARALLRLDSAAEALQVLSDACAVPAGSDESLTLRMLTGAAHVRAGEVERGLQILTDARRDADGAHSTIRSEIVLNVALAHYALRNLDAAEKSLRHVDTKSDIVYARALEYRGWIALTRADAEAATRLFVNALETLDRCRHYDRFLEANCIRALAHLAVDRLDRSTWSIVEERRARVDWSVNGLGQPNFWIAYCAATYALDVQGNVLRAAREARAAERGAPTAAARVQALCKRAAVARYAGEPLSATDHAEAAAELFATLKPPDLSGDDAIVPLVLAEQLANASLGDAARAALDTFSRYARKSSVLSMTHSPYTQAFHRLVEGAVSEAAGEKRAAIRRYREAFELYATHADVRRALDAALRLTRLSADRRAAEYAQAHARKLAPQSWMRKELEKSKTPAVKLTAVQREVLLLICRGKSNPEIGRLRKRSLHTIRNLVSRLFEIFEVSSREELAVECVRRGLYTPN